MADEASDETRRHPRWLLDQALQIAHSWPRPPLGLLVAVGLSFERGDIVDHSEAAHTHYRATGGANSWEEAVLVVGLGLLRLFERARRDG